MKKTKRIYFGCQQAGHGVPSKNLVNDTIISLNSKSMY